MAALTIDFATVLRDVPKGSWVALSNDKKRLLAFGPDMDRVIDQAHEAGESDPIIARIPESSASLFL